MIAGAPFRLVIVDDSRLFREGLVALLSAAGLSVVAELGRAEDLLAAAQDLRPDAVILDARMPPTHTDEGIRAALQIRQHDPDVGILVLSTYAEGEWARQLFSAGPAGMGYLLKDRVDDVHALVAALTRVAEGGTVVDPEVVQRLLTITQPTRTALAALSSRELEVLDLMAQGLSNAGIGRALYLSHRTVEAYVASIFTKLPLPEDTAASNRRVLAVLTYLQDHD